MAKSKSETKPARAEVLRELVLMNSIDKLVHEKFSDMPPDELVRVFNWAIDRYAPASKSTFEQAREFFEANIEKVMRPPSFAVPFPGMPPGMPPGSPPIISSPRARPPGE